MLSGDEALGTWSVSIKSWGEGLVMELVPLWIEMETPDLSLSAVAVRTQQEGSSLLARKRALVKT